MSRSDASGLFLTHGPESFTPGELLPESRTTLEPGIPLPACSHGIQAMAAQLGGRFEISAIRKFDHAQVRQPIFQDDVILVL